MSRDETGPGELARAGEIRAAARRLLRAAAVDGRLPTPVDDIVVAAGLAQPEHSMLSDHVLDQAPPHLRAAIRKLRFQRKVRAVLDREAREIHVDPTLHNQGQIAFKKLHEVGHDLCSWHRDPVYADDDETTSWCTSRCCEREANHAAAELMFQGPLMRDMAAQYGIGITAVRDLAGQFGSSGHAAFRRFAETHRHAVAGIVLDLSPSSPSPLAYRRREVVASPAWEERFGPVTAWPRVLQPVPYSFISQCPEAAAARSPVRDTFRYPDLRSDQVDLNVELCSNSYNLFALLWVPRRERFRRRRFLAA